MSEQKQSKAERDGINFRVVATPDGRGGFDLALVCRDEDGDMTFTPAWSRRLGLREEDLKSYGRNYRQAEKQAHKIIKRAEKAYAHRTLHHSVVFTKNDATIL